jgi:hypothetical protein
MVNWQQFTLESVQAALFTPDHVAFTAGRVVATVLRQFGEVFSGEMQALPLPHDVPPEIPRVVLQSVDGSRIVNAGPARFNYIWHYIGAGSQVTLPEVVQQSTEVLTYYVRESRVRVGRLALVVQRACRNETPAQTLIRRFCNEESQVEPFNRSATFEIHNHKEYQPAHEGVDYEINSWVRCRCGILDPDKKPAIVVTQDLNTMAGASEQGQFDADKVGVFLSMACKEAEAILKKYFPD